MKYELIPNPLATIFRAYDIRGVVENELTPDVVYSIGVAFGSEMQQRQQHQVIVGRDGRLSGPTLIAALIAGLRASGCDVTDIGIVPTPVTYFATYHFKIPNCMMLTGSHNPSNYNGIKMMLVGEAVASEGIEKLYRRIVTKDLAAGQGKLIQKNVIEDYINYIAHDIKLKKPLNIVIDCGNGVTGILATRLFEALGCKVTGLFCEVDGNFPNHHPDPSNPKNLRDLIASVKKLKADIGLAFDGDGDRLGVVTSEGEMIFPDRQLILFAKDLLTRHPGAEIIYDVKCTRHLSQEVEKLGGRATLSKTGHSLIKNKLKQSGALLGGEMSGHIFFKERWFGFDDGLYVGARLLEIVARDGRKSAAIFADIPQGIATPELNIAMADDQKFAFVDQLVKHGEFPHAKKITLDGLRVEYEDGWGLVRCSNTTPMLVLRFEADNEAALRRIQAIFKEQLLKIKRDLAITF